MTFLGHRFKHFQHAMQRCGFIATYAVSILLILIVFFDTKLRESTHKENERNKVTLGLFEVSLPEQAWTDACGSREQSGEVSRIVYAEAVGDFLDSQVCVDEQPFCP